MKQKPSGINTKIRTWMTVCFVGMFFFYILCALTTDIDILSTIFLLLCLTSTIAGFVLAIKHLKRYKEKGYAITVLVFHSFILFILAISFIVGLIIGILSTL